METTYTMTDFTRKLICIDSMAKKFIALTIGIQFCMILPTNDTDIMIYWPPKIIGLSLFSMIMFYNIIFSSQNKEATGQYNLLKLRNYITMIILSTIHFILLSGAIVVWCIRISDKSTEVDKLMLYQSGIFYFSNILSLVGISRFTYNVRKIITI